MPMSFSIWNAVDVDMCKCFGVQNQNRLSTAGVCLCISENMFVEKTYHIKYYQYHIDIK